MMSSLARISIACVFALSMSGCAMNAADDEETVGTTQQAATASYPIYGRATYDANLGQTMVDIATTQIPPIDVEPDHDPHILSDRFLNVRVRLVDSTGRARIATVLGGAQIGPGGGCIHFSVPGAVTGDTLFVDSIVRVGSSSPRPGHTGSIAVVDGDWINDPTVEMHPHD